MNRRGGTRRASGPATVVSTERAGVHAERFRKVAATVAIDEDEWASVPPTAVDANRTVVRWSW